MSSVQYQFMSLSGFQFKGIPLKQQQSYLGVGRSWGEIETQQASGTTLCVVDFHKLYVGGEMWVSTEVLTLGITGPETCMYSLKMCACVPP